MNVFLQLYLPSLVTGAFVAAAAAGFCFHLLARKRALEPLVPSQTTAMGTLVGLALYKDHHLIETALSPPILFAAVSMGLVGAPLARTVGCRRDDAPYRLVSLSIALGAASQILDALALKLDSHFLQLYFGDLVTLGHRDAWTMGALALAALVLLFLGRRNLERRDQEIALGAPAQRGPRERFEELAFDVGLLVVTALGVQFLGILFTLTMLLLPSALLSGRRPPSSPVKTLATLVVFSALATTGGIVASLAWTNLPTTPLVIACLATLCLAHRIAPRLIRTVRP